MQGHWFRGSGFRRSHSHEAGLGFRGVYVYVVTVHTNNVKNDAIENNDKRRKSSLYRSNNKLR